MKSISSTILLCKASFSEVEVLLDHCNIRCGFEYTKHCFELSLMGTKHNKLLSVNPKCRLNLKEKVLP